MKAFNFKDEDISIDKIKFIDNARLSTDDMDVSGLMSSIKREGLLQRIGVQDDGDGGYIFIFGSRRITALQKLGEEMVQAKVYSMGLSRHDRIILSMIENLQREDLRVIELGRQCQFLKESANMSVREIAVRIAQTPSRVQSAMRIFNKLPQKYEGLLRPHIGITSEKTGIPVTIMNKLLWLRAHKALKDETFDGLLEFVKREEVTLRQLDLIVYLMKEGRTLNGAIKERKNYEIKTIRFHLRKEQVDILRKHYPNKTIEKLFNDLVLIEIERLERQID